MGRLQSPLYNHHNRSEALAYSPLSTIVTTGVRRPQSPLYNRHNRSGAPTVPSLQSSQQEWGAHSPLSTIVTTGVRRPPHLLSATVKVYSLVAPCRLSDLTSLALLGSVSGQRRLFRGPLPGYKTVSKWRLQLQDSTPFPLLSQRFRTTLHTSTSLGCYLLFTLMPGRPLTPLGQV